MATLYVMIDLLLYANSLYRYGLSLVEVVMLLYMLNGNILLCEPVSPLAQIYLLILRATYNLTKSSYLETGSSICTCEVMWSTSCF